MNSTKGRMVNEATRRRACRIVVPIAGLVVSIAFAGCDPAYNYEPTGGRFQQVGRVRFDMKGWMTLIGSGSTSQPLTVANESDQEVVILGGRLVTNGRTFEAELPGAGEPKWRTVPPGKTESPSLYWDYGDYQAAEDVLGTELEWIWRVRVEGEEHTIRFEMKRQ